MKQITKHKKMTVALAVTSVLMSAPLVQADSFTGFNMDFVDIGDAGNADDISDGYGAVDYVYQMGKYQVSEALIDAYNTNSGGPAITYATQGANKPAGGLSWNEAARFVNWLNVDTGYAPAYKFTTGGGNDNISLWTVADAGYNANNPFRNTLAHYVLPSEDEWYKAAYYDPNKAGGAGYYTYATGSDTAPTNVAGGTAPGTAVFRQPYADGPADVTNAGGLSPYGTMGQGGNLDESCESLYTQPYNGSNNNPINSRVIRGGTWYDWPTNKGSRDYHSPGYEASSSGFRVATVTPVPEPSSVSLIVIGAVGFLLKRKRA